MSGRGGRRGSGAGRPMPRGMEVSKAMSWILRHGAEKENLKLDEQGYANVAELLAWRKLRGLKVSFEELQEIVRSNDKQRFALIPVPSSSGEPLADPSDPANYLIRATQGHSLKIASESLLQPLDSDDLPVEVVHGTFYGTWPLILGSRALKPMGRTHVHFALAPPGGETQVVSGMRRDAQLLVWVDCHKARELGVKWWRSENGVVLAEGEVPLEAFRTVEDRKGDLGVIWEGGEVKKDMPEEFLAKGIPREKQRGGNHKGQEKKKRPDKPPSSSNDGTQVG